MAITDKIMAPSTGTSRPTPTTLASQKGVGDTILNADDLTGWGTTTAVTFVLYKVDSNGKEIENTRTDWKGIVVGNTITQLTLTAGNDTIYPEGSPVIATPTARYGDDLASALLNALNQNGTLKDSSVTNSMLADNTIGFSKLLSTIFSGQVTTYSNPGSASGTFYYTNLGGIKLFWGQTGSVAVSGAGYQSTTATVTFPASFFSTIQTAPVTATSFINSINMTCGWTADPTATGGSVYYIQNGNGSNGAAKAAMIVIGT